MSAFEPYFTKETLDTNLTWMIEHPDDFKMSKALRWHVDNFLPVMEPGSTFLDAGCHIGYTYHYLVNVLKLDINYHGIDVDADFINLCLKRFGPHFELCNFLEHHTSYDYVWCTQMCRSDNPTCIRHLAGLARKKLIYSHAIPCEGNWDERFSVDVVKLGRFEVITI